VYEADLRQSDELAQCAGHINIKVSWSMIHSIILSLRCNATPCSCWRAPSNSRYGASVCHSCMPIASSQVGSHWLCITDCTITDSAAGTPLPPSNSHIPFLLTAVLLQVYASDTPIDGDAAMSDLPSSASCSEERPVFLQDGIQELHSYSSSGSSSSGSRFGQRHGSGRQPSRAGQQGRSYTGSGQSGRLPLPMGLTWREYLILHTDCRCSLLC
jgi:hypothetical protein